MSFRRLKTVYVNTAHEFNKLLEYARKYRFIALKEYDYEDLGAVAFINDKLVEIELVMQTDKATRYVFYKDLRKNEKIISGMDAYIPMANSFRLATGYKLPIFENPDDFGTANALLAYRPKYAETKRVEAWAYDANSAYGWGLTQPMPDTREFVGVNRIVQEGELGFVTDEKKLKGFKLCDEYRLRMVGPGHGATYIFKAIDSPFKSFAERWYDKKLNAKTSEEKAKAKQMLCYSVGFLQRKNPFLRAAVVEHCNNYMEKLIDENTIYINTDSIVSTKPREDIPLGTGMGEFKIEHHGMFANSGFNCQWNHEAPTYRGIPKSWFDEKYDILSGRVPTNQNIYDFNAVTIQLEERK